MKNGIFAINGNTFLNLYVKYLCGDNLVSFFGFIIKLGIVVIGYS